MYTFKDPDMQEFYDEIISHDSLQHPVLQTLKTNGYNEYQAGHIIKGYVRYSRIFPRLLTVGMNHWKDSSEIYEKLHSIFDDEVNVEGTSHSDQLNMCADSFDIEYDEDILEKIGEVYIEYAQTLLELCQSDKSVALGVVGPATEWVVPNIYTNFISWFQQNEPEKYEFSFFTEHLEVDKEHASLIADVIVDAKKIGASIKTVSEGAYKALKARNTLWDGIQPLVPA